MNTYKVYITGTFKVSTTVKADSKEQALEIVDNYGIEVIEGLVFEQGVAGIDNTTAVQVPTVGYIVQANGDQFHRFFSSEYDLLQHLNQRQKELYLGAVEYKDLLSFFFARNYVRVV
jgi:hypothetical protein